MKKLPDGIMKGFVVHKTSTGTSPEQGIFIAAVEEKLFRFQIEIELVLALDDGHRKRRRLGILVFER